VEWEKLRDDYLEMESGTDNVFIILAFYATNDFKAEMSLLSVCSSALRNSICEANLL
jgi:hypothetical protein